MKIRWHDKDLWASMEFRSLEGWAKLLYYYMYDIADLAGIVELDVTLAEAYIKTKLPKNIDEIEEELEPFFVRVGKNLFLIKYFIETTQGGSLTLHNPPHVQILKDMVQRYKKGFTDVVSQVRKWNPALAVQTIEEAKGEVNEYNKNAGNNQSKQNGLKGRIKAVEDSEKLLLVLCSKEFPQIGVSTDSEAIELDEQVEEIEEKKEDEVINADF